MADTEIIGPEKVELISMSFRGMEPLSPDDLQWFTTRTEDYITDYYNLDQSCGGICYLKDINVTKVVIEVSEQDPPFDGGRRRYLHSLRNSRVQARADEVDADVNVNFDAKAGFETGDLEGALKVQRMDNGRDSGRGRDRGLQLSNSKLTITFSQTSSYQRVITDGTAEDGEIDVKDIVKEPFNNIGKRMAYRDNYLKAPTTLDQDDVPAAFKNLTIVEAPIVQEPPSSIFGIGLIAAIASGGLVLLVLTIFMICRCRGGKNPEKYQIEEHPKSTRSGRSAEYQNGQLPSQVDLPKLNDEVSTLVDPSPQYGVYNSNHGGKSLQGYNNTPSIATMDPDYMGIYGGGAEDPSVVSSSGGTFGSQTAKSKYTMESTLTPGMNAGGQSIYTEDEQAFEDHLRNRKKAQQKEEFFEIYAPAGKLGVVIDTPNSGAPVVHNIKETCPIADQLRVGDKLIAVDDEDVRSMTAVKVSKLISQKSNNPTRKFTICRAIEELQSSP
eukprot:CAMPEP_0203662892 /NCGR_PEP_ID=MMETSP0090-20130426/692_1 /ASSEMBLY_ACC=CAM_ASM_001088 /TAXON_ID=426623 /ORGANISM="Chaetoceros affinis, Strain CCMP159" /LENGTH=496 /DNA_ID=CAMNT_0050525733 /DNA_START=542 /DNA_END=2032 /DNA_ORIENTATION=-